MNEATQLPLFGRRLETAAAHAPVHKRKKFRGDCLRILDRLQQGPATAIELMQICVGYRQRISDLRAGGYPVVCDESGDVNIYTL